MEQNITLECEAIYCKVVLKQFQTISIVLVLKLVTIYRVGNFHEVKIPHISRFDPIRERLFVAELARPPLRVADRGKGNS